MVYCSAFGCNNRSKKGCGLSFFSFPKDESRKRAWTHFCRRKDFVATANSRLCSIHFSNEQLDRDPSKLEENGYLGARIRLKPDAIPDIPLPLTKSTADDSTKAIVNLPHKTQRNAYTKRRKAEAIQEVMREMEQHSRSDDSPACASVDTQTINDAATVGACILENSDQTEVSIKIVPRTKDKKCQASLQPPQRTRRIQVSTSTESRKESVSIGVQCSSITNNVPLRVAAGLIPNRAPVISDSEEEEEEKEEEEIEKNEDSDPDFDPSEEREHRDEEEDESYVFPLKNKTDVEPQDDQYFMVAESCLANLLQRCSFCGAPCESAVHFTRGTMIGTQSTCVNGHVSQWESQRCHNRMPWLNLLLSGAIVFTGINASKCLRFLKHLNIPTISASTFSRIQSAYTVPTAIFSWDFQQMELIEQCKDRTLILGGDARCDSPGFSAKFGSYTLMDLECGKVLDFQ